MMKRKNHLIWRNLSYRCCRFNIQERLTFLRPAVMDKYPLIWSSSNLDPHSKPDSGSDYLEEDIYGKCITNYEQSGLEFRKTRDLTQCSSSNQNALIFGRLGSMSSAMSASLDCVARVGLKKVSCSETRKIAQPFDQSDELFSTFIQSNLVLKKESSTNELVEYSYDQVTSLKLDLLSNDLTADLYSDAENILKDICSARASINDFGDVPRHIKSLMVTMEQLQAQFKHLKYTVFRITTG